jgi:hypothetical protein
MEQETQNVTHPAQADHLEEWQQTEPFDTGHEDMPAGRNPGRQLA